MTTHGYTSEGILACLANVVTPGTAPLMRLYNPTTGHHYYTANLPEHDFLMGVGLISEGNEAFLATSPQPGTRELFRMYNRNPAATSTPSIHRAELLARHASRHLGTALERGLVAPPNVRVREPAEDRDSEDGRPSDTRRPGTP